MSDTIAVTLNAQATILSNSIPLAKSFSITLEGTSYISTRQSMPTGGTAEAFQKGEIATIKYVLAVNEDPTNYVTIYNQATVSGAVALTEIGPGEAVFFRPNAANIYCAANTGACILNFIAFGG